jgi:choline dehydrogenase-like flavoprotein
VTDASPRWVVSFRGSLPSASTGRFVARDAGLPRQEGVGWYDVTQRNARRESSATAYLRPARERNNLTIHTHALATQVIVDNGRATGLRYAIKGKPAIARANQELILSGGSVNSPRLLLLSGIGPAEELVAAGLEYLLFRTGPITACVCEAGMFVLGSDDVETCECFGFGAQALLGAVAGRVDER